MFWRSRKDSGKFWEHRLWISILQQATSDKEKGWSNSQADRGEKGLYVSFY